ncbi:cupin domain-containing protein [bacterium]|nr:cupin domain-containing protein [bacterium]
MKGSAFHTPDLHWQELHGFPGSAQVKVLRFEPRSGAKTMLVKLPREGTIRSHVHPVVAQHYILEGAYETEDRSFTAGTFRLLSAHEPVAEITTREGVLFLLAIDPAVTTTETIP